MKTSFKKKGLIIFLILAILMQIAYSDENDELDQDQGIIDSHDSNSLPGAPLQQDTQQNQDSQQQAQATPQQKGEQVATASEQNIKKQELMQDDLQNTDGISDDKSQKQQQKPVETDNQGNIVWHAMPQFNSSQVQKPSEIPQKPTNMTNQQYRQSLIKAQSDIMKQRLELSQWIKDLQAKQKLLVQRQVNMTHQESILYDKQIQIRKLAQDFQIRQNQIANITHTNQPEILPPSNENIITQQIRQKLQQYERLKSEYATQQQKEQMENMQQRALQEKEKDIKGREQLSEQKQLSLEKREKQLFEREQNLTQSIKVQGEQNLFFDKKNQEFSQKNLEFAERQERIRKKEKQLESQKFQIQEQLKKFQQQKFQLANSHPKPTDPTKIIDQQNPISQKPSQLPNPIKNNSIAENSLALKEEQLKLLQKQIEQKSLKLIGKQQQLQDKVNKLNEEKQKLILQEVQNKKLNDERLKGQESQGGDIQGQWDRVGKKSQELKQLQQKLFQKEKKLQKQSKKVEQQAKQLVSKTQQIDQQKKSVSQDKQLLEVQKKKVSSEKTAIIQQKKAIQVANTLKNTNNNKPQTQSDQMVQLDMEWNTFYACIGFLGLFSLIGIFCLIKSLTCNKNRRQGHEVGVFSSNFQDNSYS